MATSSRSMADRPGAISPADGGTFEVGYTGSFSLAASIRFLEGFTPAGYESPSPNHLDLAFCAAPAVGTPARRPEWLKQAGKRVIGSFVGDVSSRKPWLSNVARILSLDVDAQEFPWKSGGETTWWRDCKRSIRGLRPVCFGTPYEAAQLLGGHRAPASPHERGRRRQGDRWHNSSATPWCSLEQRCSPFLRRSDWSISRVFPDSRAASLSGYAGSLELPSMAGSIRKRCGRSRARRQSTSSRNSAGSATPPAGVDPAEGCRRPRLGPTSRRPDSSAPSEVGLRPRYHLDDDEVVAITSGWTPYRTWVSLLLRVNLEDSTHELRAATADVRT